MKATTKPNAGKPLDPIKVAPVGVSKLNCEALCGLTERQLYELGRAHKLPRLPGKIPVYRADAVLALFSTGDVGVEHAAAEPDDVETTAQVLARLGRRTAGAR